MRGKWSFTDSSDEGVARGHKAETTTQRRHSHFGLEDILCGCFIRTLPCAQAHIHTHTHPDTYIWMKNIPSEGDHVCSGSLTEEGSSYLASSRRERAASSPHQHALTISSHTWWGSVTDAHLWWHLSSKHVKTQPNTASGQMYAVNSDRSKINKVIKLQLFFSDFSPCRQCLSLRSNHSICFHNEITAPWTRKLVSFW